MASGLWEKAMQDGILCTKVVGVWPASLGEEVVSKRIFLLR